MKISYSQVASDARESVEAECERHIAKLDKLLKRYDPDLVQLHCTLEKTPRRVEFGCSLNLTLPTGSLTDGTSYFTMSQAVDIAGNLQSNLTTNYFRIDVTSPTSAVTSPARVRSRVVPRKVRGVSGRLRRPGGSVATGSYASRAAS